MCRFMIKGYYKRWVSLLCILSICLPSLLFSSFQILFLYLSTVFCLFSKILFFLSFQHLFKTFILFCSFSSFCLCYFYLSFLHSSLMLKSNSLQPSYNNWKELEDQVSERSKSEPLSYIRLRKPFFSCTAMPRKNCPSNLITKDQVLSELKQIWWKLNVHAVIYF